ncbi:ScbA/BarX family gamma-butyrolactone biosynthesis protein [Streptomyces sp. NPDC050264]|uniref:ScbA/BarX family gamma-butyrolactone biosynthesis protein n=1 Tax=Streptomyces sp. NPDC050264 TaxID=3155038 RepID=UPI00342EBDC2
MNVALEPVVDDPAVPVLAFEQTVPRTLVHRSALSEVFLTDSRPLDDVSYLAGAQLPPSHAYFTDHTTPQAVDPLLLLECCRQAETHAVHAHFGADATTRFVLESWSADLPGLAEPASGPGPSNLVIEVETLRPHLTGTTLRGMAYRMRLSLSGAYMGEVSMRVKYVSTEVYRMLRGRAGTVLPTSDDYRAADAPGLVAPERVGRRRAENVVLLDPAVQDDRLRARLRVAGEHPSLFDHAQDHLPGMVLMEAGRQAALLAAEEFLDVPANRWTITGFSASFRAYTELDRPVTVVAHRPEDAAHPSGRAVEVAVRFEQEGSVVAEARFGALRQG